MKTIPSLGFLARYIVDFWHRHLIYTTALVDIGVHWGLVQYRTLFGVLYGSAIEFIVPRQHGISHLARSPRIGLKGHHGLCIIK